MLHDLSKLIRCELCKLLWY